MKELLQYELLGNPVQRYLMVVLIFLIVMVLAKRMALIINTLIFRIIKRIVPDLQKGELDAQLLAPLQYIIIFFGLALAVQALNFPPALDITIFDMALSDLLYGLFRLVMVIGVSWILIRLVHFISTLIFSKVSLTPSKQDDQLLLFIRDALKIIIVFWAAFFIISNIFNYDITTLVAGAGLAGLALALAAKDTLENLLGSLVIFIEKPFVVGDFVEVGGTAGTVESVGFRSTRLRTVEKTFVTLPNRKIIDSKLDNMTLRSYRRVKLNVALTYNTGSEKVKTIIQEIRHFLKEHPETMDDPTVSFYELGENGIKLLIQYHLSNPDWQNYVKVREEVNFEIMKIVETHKSQFAYPTQTIQIKR